jgi:hypothetical protein
MLFKKLFQVLVLGGAAVATTSGCMSSADAQSAKKDTMRDAGSAAAAPDAGMRSSASGGGAKTW